MGRLNLNRTEVVRTPQRLALPLVTRVTEQTFNGAMRLAPRGSHLSGSGKRREGKSITGGMYRRMRVTNSNIVSRIGSTADHAASMHQGSKAHRIPLNTGGKVLKFKWKRSLFSGIRRRTRVKSTGGFVYLIKVRHPGNKRPVRYLTTPLTQFGRRAGFRVSRQPVNRGFLP